MVHLQKNNFPLTSHTKAGAVLKSPACIYQLPPPAPPYTGGELITKRFLPLCEGELVGVVI